MLVPNNAHITYCLHCYKYQSTEYKYITLYNYTCSETQLKVPENTVKRPSKQGIQKSENTRLNTDNTVKSPELWNSK